MSIRSFLDRFIHPWVAAIASAGVVLWVVAFLVAAAGLAVRAVDAILAVELFLISGVVGATGTLVLLCCVLWLAGLRTVQVVRARRG